MPEIDLQLYARYNGTAEEINLSSHINITFDPRKGFIVANILYLANIHGPITCKVANSTTYAEQKFYLDLMDENENTQAKQKNGMDLDMVPTVSISHITRGIEDFLLCNIEASPLIGVNTSVSFLECLDRTCSSKSYIGTKLNYTITKTESDRVTYVREMLIPVVEGLHGDVICTAVWPIKGSDRYQYTDDRYPLRSTNEHIEPEVQNMNGESPTVQSTDEQSPTALAIGLIIAATVLAIVLLVCGGFINRKIQSNKKYKQAPLHDHEPAVEEEEIRLADFATSNNSDEGNDAERLTTYSAHHRLEFPLEQLDFGEVLGKGQFGIVKKALARGIRKRHTAEDTEVAVKTTKTKPGSKDEIEALEAELEIMSDISHHNNVVNLLGACTMDIARGHLYIIMELCQLGSLKNILLKHKSCFRKDLLSRNISLGYPSLPTLQENTGIPSGHWQMNGESLTHAPGHYTFAVQCKQKEYLTLGDLLQWSLDVAKGMKHLSEDKFLHCDLASRNILIAGDGTAKICDFGLGKSMDQTSVYHKMKRHTVPVSWLAPECLDLERNEYSTHSDVWSYGVLLWEMFTLGEEPFPELKKYPLRLLYKLRQGDRLMAPNYTPPSICGLMSDCWKMEPSERPTFDEIVGLLVKQMKMNNLPGSVTSGEVGEHHDYLQMLSPARPYVNLPKEQLNKI